MLQAPRTSRVRVTRHKHPAEGVGRLQAGQSAAVPAPADCRHYVYNEVSCRDFWRRQASRTVAGRHQSTAALFDAGGLMAVAPAIRETVSGVGAGHLDSSPDAHAVGTELDQIPRRSKRLGRAIGVQGADLMEANPGRGPTMGEYFGCLRSHAICASVRLFMERRS